MIPLQKVKWGKIVLDYDGLLESLSLKLLNGTGRRCEREDVTEENEASSLYFEFWSF